MPRNTPEQAQARRDEITRAAWRCFTRDGFHATSMDDVIREASLSAGAVYRYFPGKSALVTGAVSSAFASARGVFDELLAHPELGPADAVQRVVERIEQVSSRDGYDLGRLAVSAWGEALRDPVLGDLARQVYGHVRGSFATLARRWQEAGTLDPGTDPAELAQALFSLVPGFLLQRALLGDVEPEAYARGVAGLVGARR